MEENKNYSIEPQGEEPIQESREPETQEYCPVKEPSAQENWQNNPNPYAGYYQANPRPGYQNPYQPNYPPMYGYPYAQETAAPKPPKKKSGWKIALLVVGVAIAGVLGGTLLSSAIDLIRGRDVVQEQQMEQPDQKTEKPDQMPEQPAEQEQPQAQVPAEKTEKEPDYELDVHGLPTNLPTNDAGKNLTLVQVYEMAVNSVVGIETEIKTNIFGQEAVAASRGSGFILTEDGYVITNAHVVDGAQTIKVNTYDGQSYKAQLVGADSDYDVAVLKIEAENLQAVTVADSDTLKVGEEVAAIGNPLGELTFTMTAGIISALDREINVDGNPQNMLQTNAAINSGNSGGPLFDMNGNVIGVTTAKFSGSSSSGASIEGLGFAIPINDALRVAYDLVEHGYLTGQAYLGVHVKDLDSSTAKYYSLPVGPRVEEIVPGSCAERDGIKVGDIIFKFNGTDVADTAALTGALKKVSAGDTVKIVVYSAGAEVELEVTLDERPRDE